MVFNSGTIIQNEDATMKFVNDGISTLKINRNNNNTTTAVTTALNIVRTGIFYTICLLCLQEDQIAKLQLEMELEIENITKKYLDRIQTLKEAAINKSS